MKSCLEMNHRFIEYSGNRPCPVCEATDKIEKLSRKLTTAIDHLKDWAGYASSGAKYSAGDHQIYQPQISVASVERLRKTIEMLERGN